MFDYNTRSVERLMVENSLCVRVQTRGPLKSRDEVTKRKRGLIETMRVKPSATPDRRNMPNTKQSRDCAPLK
jgi:hypothetical protein